MQKSKGQAEYVNLRKSYQASLKKYARKIQKTKIVSWRNFVTTAGNENPWGYVYRQQAEKIRVAQVLSTLRVGTSKTAPSPKQLTDS